MNKFHIIAIKENHLKNSSEQKKAGLHPRNKHNSRYDFKELSNCYPQLKSFLSVNKYNDESIDFANPDAVKALNTALLKFFYAVEFWDIPKNYLCPPIPGRADYIHQIADLLGIKNSGKIPTGEKIRILDIGVGANCIYPLIGHSEYKWNFVGSEIDPVAFNSANEIINKNHLNNFIEIRQQKENQNIFKNIILEKEFFDITISNPPFHSSAEEALSSNERKNTNLNRNKGVRSSQSQNFGGVQNELWCQGGEVQFISQMIRESAEYKFNCYWFTTLVSKFTNLPPLYEELKKNHVVDFKTIDMEQGQKKSRILAWTYHTK